MAEVGVSLDRPVLAIESDDVRAALRTATWAAHERLDAALPLTSPTLTLDRWHTTLRRFYGIYEPLERQYARIAELEPAFESLVTLRRKAHLLEADLRHLGDTPATIASLPRCGVSDLARTPAETLGAMYVTEGATLGGRLIARHAERHLGLHRGHGYSFFQSYGTDVGTMWRRFLSVLRRYDTPDDRPAIVAGAAGTFAAMEAWLGSVGV